MPWVEDDSEEIQVAGPGGRWVEDDSSVEPSLADQAGRQAGLMARTAIKGVTGIPAMIGDAANAAVNYGIRGANALTGAQLPQLGMVSDAINRGLDKVGLPQPSNTIERLNEVAGSALFGAGGAQVAANSMRQIPRLGAIATEFARGPIAQGVGAATGMLATEGAESAGIKNPYALAAIGMIGAAVPGSGAAGALGSVRAAAQPFRRVGQDVIVGRALNRLATNPEAAAQRLAEARQIVPGSAPMVSQASGDAGLAGAESALRGMDTRNVVGQRLGEQNSARMRELDRIAGDEATVSVAEAKRDRAVTDILDPAFRNKTPIPMGREWINNPVRRTIQSIRETPAGARKTVRDALDEAEALLTQEGVDITDAETLYEIRKDLALARDGKLVGAGKSGAELSNLRNARSQLNDVIASLDEQIERGAPGYTDYLRLYSRRSVPLDQLEALQTIRQRAVLAAPDPTTGQPVLSQAKFTNLLRNNLDQGLNLRGRGPDGAKLSQNQIATLDRIAADLDRGAAPTAATVRSPGSDTFKNMSVAAVIGRILGDGAADLVGDSSAVKTLVRPLSFLYRVPDEQIQQLMLEAWMNPRLASQLMRRATEADIRSVAQQLGESIGRQAAADAIYSQR